MLTDRPIGGPARNRRPGAARPRAPA
jgi:hypothetical protein